MMVRNQPKLNFLGPPLEIFHPVNLTSIISSIINAFGQRIAEILYLDSELKISCQSMDEIF